MPAKSKTKKEKSQQEDNSNKDRRRKGNQEHGEKHPDLEGYYRCLGCGTSGSFQGKSWYAATSAEDFLVHHPSETLCKENKKSANRDARVLDFKRKKMEPTNGKASCGESHDCFPPIQIHQGSGNKSRFSLVVVCKRGCGFVHIIGTIQNISSVVEFNSGTGLTQGPSGPPESGDDDNDDEDDEEGDEGAFSGKSVSRSRSPSET